MNNSRLFVAAETGEFKLKFLQEPADVENGNFLRLIDWSPDSRRLLAEVTEWQYEQPGSNSSVLLYDSRIGSFQQPDLQRSFAKTYGHDCSMNLRVLGFGAQGAIVLEGQPLTPGRRGGFRHIELREEEHILRTGSHDGESGVSAGDAEGAAQCQGGDRKAVVTMFSGVLIETDAFSAQISNRRVRRELPPRAQRGGCYDLRM